MGEWAGVIEKLNLQGESVHFKFKACGRKPCCIFTIVTISQRLSNPPSTNPPPLFFFVSPPPFILMYRTTRLTMCGVMIYGVKEPRNKLSKLPKPGIRLVKSLHKGHPSLMRTGWIIAVDLMGPRSVSSHLIIIISNPGAKWPAQVCYASPIDLNWCALKQCRPKFKTDLRQTNRFAGKCISESIPTISNNSSPPFLGPICVLRSAVHGNTWKSKRQSAVKQKKKELH